MIPPLTVLNFIVVYLAVHTPSLNMNKECSLTDRLGPTSFGRAESIDGRAYKSGDYMPSPDK